MKLPLLFLILRYSARIVPMVQFLQGVGDRQCITAAELRYLFSTASLFLEPLGIDLDGIAIAPELSNQAAIATEASARQAREIEQYKEEAALLRQEIQRSMDGVLSLQSLSKRQATQILEMREIIGGQAETIEANQHLLAEAIAKGQALLELVAQLQTAQSALLVYDSRELFERASHEPIPTPN